MASYSSIEWTDSTWNPVTGCSKISPGCKNCYAERMAKRLAGRFGYPKDDPFRVALHHDRLEEPLRWRKPRMVFVCSMGDLFHEDVPFPIPALVFDIAGKCPQHTFQILTKRPQRMREFTQWMAGADDISTAEWPRNCWLGVTAENQAMADQRIPLLLQTPAAVRFVSVEPMLGPVELTRAVYGPEPGPMNWFGFTDGFGYEACLQWVICGGETGPGARPMHPDWVRSLRDQCQAAQVPFFFKQWGAYLPNDQEYCCYQPEADYNKPHVLVDHHGQEVAMARVGKKAAGALLDGREWREMPTTRGAVS
jgi:protein gp37